jgi:hypothetical protein
MPAGIDLPGNGGRAENIMKKKLLFCLLSCVMTATLTSAADKQFVSKFSVAEDEWTNIGGNSYFKLEPGNTLVLEAKDGAKLTRLTITVLDETLKVDGVETRVVEERETENGQLVEVSRNYCAASKKTKDVYYFGEDVDMYQDGKVTGHGGSWRAGVNGAKFGLMMAGTPRVGDRYYQELAGDVARDRAEIVSLTESLETPAGKFTNCLKTEETTPLEPGVKEYKVYAPGVGLIKEGDLLLTRFGRSASRAPETGNVSICCSGAL